MKHVVLVMSGKGGVGKSTCATNLALALKRAGHRVGLLDADIYGPSIPTMLGVMGRPVSTDGKTIEPLERFGVKLMSIGFLLEDPKQAVIWRGPMLHGALQQFLNDVHWGELDFLVLDLPPGTGDVALTLSQKVKVTGAVIVTTPQPVATDDVFKSVSMCQKVNIPILGVVENMSFFIDPAGLKHELFGKGGGQAVADFAHAPLLGQVPIDQSVREWGDKGTPVVQAAPESSVALAFIAIAERLVEIVEKKVEDEAPLIDRSGSGRKRRLPVDETAIASGGRMTRSGGVAPGLRDLSGPRLLPTFWTTSRLDVYTRDIARHGDVIPPTSSGPVTAHDLASRTT